MYTQLDDTRECLYFIEKDEIITLEMQLVSNTLSIFVANTVRIVCLDEELEFLKQEDGEFVKMLKE